MRTTKLMCLCTALLLGAFIALPSAAAQALSGVKGQLTDLQGKPIANAVLVFTRTDMAGGPFKVKSNKQGNYIITTLPIGTYDLTLTGPDGKILSKQTGIITHPGDPQELDLDMKEAAKAQAAATSELAAGGAPPGMSKEEAAAYAKKVKDDEAANSKIGQLNVLLAKNKQLEDAKNWDEAITTMEQAVALDATHDVLFANLGDDYAGGKQYDKAIAAYQKAITLNPNNAGYHINLGTVYAKAGKMDEAKAEFNKAKTQDPTQAKMALYNTAVILYNAGKMDDAVTAFNEVIAADPTNADAWYYKGMALVSSATEDPKTQKMIPAPGTVEALQKSLQLAPNGPNVPTIKDTLAAFNIH